MVSSWIYPHLSRFTNDSRISTNYLNLRRFSETASSQQTSKNNQGQDAGGVIGMIPVQEPIHLWLRGPDVSFSVEIGDVAIGEVKINSTQLYYILYWCVYCVYVYIDIYIYNYICICIDRERERDCYFVIMTHCYFPITHQWEEIDFLKATWPIFPWIVMIHHLGLWVTHPDPWNLNDLWGDSTSPMMKHILPWLSGKNPKIIIGSLIYH